MRTLLFVLLFLWDGFMGLYLLLLVFSFIFLAFFNLLKFCHFFNQDIKKFVLTALTQKIIFTFVTVLNNDKRWLF